MAQTKVRKRRENIARSNDGTPRRKKTLVSAEERQTMLFWWTVYGGNEAKTARKVSEITGIPRHRKVVHETAKKHNFATLSHLVRDQVNKKFYDDSSPGMNRLMKMAMDLMEIDEKMIDHVKNYLFGGNGSTQIKSMGEAVTTLKYITMDMESLTGKKGVKHNSFEEMAEQTQPEIGISVSKILDELTDEAKEEVIGKIIDLQTAKILDYKN